MERVALALIGALLLCSAASIDTASILLSETKDWVVDVFDWLFVGTVGATLVLVAALGILPRANVRLGPDDCEPEFSTFSWFAMLFSAGLASGLLYWAVAEPIMHFQANPFLGESGISASSPLAVESALRITIFHWALHGWALYVLCGLSIAIYSYRHGRPLAIRSALYPLLGERFIDRWPGRFVDLLALLGTVFGVATSIGFGAAGLNATLGALVGLEIDRFTQIGIVFAVCGLGILSATSGLARGVRRLSEINVWVSAALLAALLMLGPTTSLLSQILRSGGDYLITFVPLGFWIGTTESEQTWQSGWTVFYWGWWLAWMPFVSLFIARISKGRTLREFVSGVMGVPTLVIIVWMVIFGGSALHQEIANPGSVSAAVNEDYSLGIVSLLENLADPAIATALTCAATFLLFTWLITSLDSATLVLCHLVERPDARAHQVLWGIILAVVTCALIWLGGVPALQAASIIIGLPLALVTLGIGAGLLRAVIRGEL